MPNWNLQFRGNKGDKRIITEDIRGDELLGEDRYRVRPQVFELVEIHETSNGFTVHRLHVGDIQYLSATAYVVQVYASDSGLHIDHNDHTDSRRALPTENR